MSGGVDSSVAAMLLKEQGYDVIGVTMQIWQDEEEAAKEANGGCCGLSAVDDARRVAQRLEIPYYVMNFKKEFKCHVMDYFVDEYLRGHTPNPCIACNRYVKWESLLQRSLEIGADYIATGHYARIDRLPNGRFAIRNSVTAAKDQTYALYNLTQDQLSHTLMPVGELVLTENPRDYGAEVESAAFSPANLVEGIELSADKMLQGRSFIYWDAQRHRLGKDFRQIPVNHMPGWQPSDMVTSGNGVRVCGYQERSGLNKSDDFTQAGQYYMALSPTGRQHLAENIALELVLVKPQTRACILSYLNQVHQQLKIQVEQAMLE